MGDETRGLLGNEHTDEESDKENLARVRGQRSVSQSHSTAENGSRRINTKKVPLGMWLLESIGLLRFKPLLSHKALVLILTFLCYTSYHLSRKPFSVVKVVLCPECANCSYAIVHNTSGWPPFNDVSRGQTLFGIIDYTYLFAYAIAMFVSGQIADRTNLRYFLFFGMMGSGITVALMGVAYFAEIHGLWYFIVVQAFGGVMQSTGWPGTVAVMGNWFGKHNRGLILGVWNSHTSVGNILGTIIPSFWADCDGDADPWGWAFIVPAAIIMFVGAILFLFLVTDPQHVGLPSPMHHIEGESPQSVDHSHRVYAEEQPDPDLSTEEDKLFKKQKGLDESDSDIAQTSVQQTSVKETHPKPKSKPVNFLRAFLIPGVLEFSFALFFDKLVSYTFLFWLPFYVKTTLTNLSGPESDWLSTLFDVGGIIGGILAGVISDLLRARALTCVCMLILAIPTLFVLEAYAGASFGWFVALLVISGVFVNGPYSMITTAVSSDLGTHESLQGNQNAKATVTAIIDGTGSLGAAFGPLLIGWITNDWGWMAAFYVLMGSCALSALLLSRLVVKDIISIYRRSSNACYSILALISGSLLPSFLDMFYNRYIVSDLFI